MMTTQDFGSVTHDNQSILICSQPQPTGRVIHGDEIEWSANGLLADRSGVEIYWLMPDVEDTDAMDWETAGRVEPSDWADPPTFDSQLHDALADSDSAHWIATRALYAARGSWTGPATLRALADLHDDMSDSDPADIVTEFIRRRAADKNIAE